MNLDSLLFTLLIDIAAILTLVLMVARTAKSKGRSPIAWGLLAFISPTVTSGFAIFIRPGGLAAERPYRTKLLSMVAYAAGILVQLWSLSTLPVNDKMTDTELVQALASTSSVGALMIFGAGILLIIGAVANERFSVANPSDQ